MRVTVKDPIPNARRVTVDGSEHEWVAFDEVEDLLTLMGELGEPLILYPASADGIVNSAAPDLPPGDLPSILVYDDYVE